MKDGAKWTLWGGFIGLILLFIATFIFRRFLILYPSLSIDWQLAIAVPIYTGVLAWGVKFFDQKNKDEVKQLNTRIDSKADQSEITRLEQSIDDHKDTNEKQFDQIHELMTIFDHKLDKMLDVILKK